MFCKEGTFVLLCFVTLHLADASSLTDMQGIFQFNTKTVASSICVGTAVKTNQDDGETEIKFTTYYDDNRERARSQQQQQQEQEQYQQNKECIPAVQCGVLYFPTNTETLLDHLIEQNANLYSVIMKQNVLSLAVGSRGRLANAIVKGAHDRHRRRSKHSPSAYLLRRVLHSRASAGKFIFSRSLYSLYSLFFFFFFSFPPK